MYLHIKHENNMKIKNTEPMRDLVLANLKISNLTKILYTL